MTLYHPWAGAVGPCPGLCAFAVSSAPSAHPRPHSGYWVPWKDGTMQFYVTVNPTWTHLCCRTRVWNPGVVDVIIPLRNDFVAGNGWSGRRRAGGADGVRRCRAGGLRESPLACGRLVGVSGVCREARSSASSLPIVIFFFLILHIRLEEGS